MAALRVLGLDDVPTADTQFVDGKFLVEWVLVLCCRVAAFCVFLCAAPSSCGFLAVC